MKNGNSYIYKYKKDTQSTKVTAPLPTREGPGEGLLGRALRCVGLLLCLLFLFSSCKESKPQLTEAKGTPSELLVVLSPDLVGTDVADTVQTITECDAPGLGSSERIFRTMTIGAPGYQKVYRLMHSQLHVELDPRQRQPMLGVARDVTARPQLQLMVRAATARQLKAFLSQEREHIQHLILDFQLDRWAAMLCKKHSRKVAQEMHRLGYTIAMPVDLQSAKRGKHFLWASSNRGGDRDVNFVFFSLPWTGQSLADVDRFVHLRDSVLRRNIPGPTEGQWMATMRAPEGAPVVWPMLRRDGQQLEVRGLWSMHGGFMGGPFVTHVRVDTLRRRLLFAEGFVFSPNTPKRDLLRSLEAGLRTIDNKR